jgi:xylulose-5-phosphate/fructose-6-phosphate phosphoketolase
MTVVNGLDRYHLSLDVIARVPRMRRTKPARELAARLKAKLVEHHDYICANGEDMPEIQQWRWAQPG